MSSPPPPRRSRLFWRALALAAFLAGAGTSLGLLGQSSRAALVLCAALFLAAIAFAVLNRETHR